MTKVWHEGEGLQPGGDADFGSAFEHVLDADPFRWPILYMAAKTPQAAHSTKVEWLVEVERRCDLGHKHRVREAEFNYTQIFRRPWTMRVGDSISAKIREHLELLLDDVESVFRNGLRHADFSGSWPMKTAGGVFDLLGRWPRKDDTLKLSMLRAPFLSRHDRDQWGNATDNDTYEWLMEATLIAIKEPSK